MIIPVRCFSCGKVIGNSWEEYQKMLEDGVSVKDAMDKLELKRFCCRAAVMTQVDTIDIVGRF